MATSTTARPTASARGRLPAPVRDRRPALAALALLLVIGGALISALVAYRSGDRVDVLVTSREIPVGQEVTEADFRVARVASEGAAFVDASAVRNFIGTRATGTFPEGTLVNSAMFQVGSVVPDDGALVGVVLTASQRPVTGLRQGDVVSVFAVPRDSAGAQATPLLTAVRVAEVGRIDNSGGQSVSLLVPARSATTVVGPTTGGEVSVTKLASGTTPVIDFVQD